MLSQQTVPDYLHWLPSEAVGVEQRIRQILGNRIRDLRVHKHDGGWVLQGSAATYHVKQLAQEAVMKTTTLPILANRIQVVPRRSGFFLSQ